MLAHSPPTSAMTSLPTAAIVQTTCAYKPLPLATFRRSNIVRNQPSIKGQQHRQAAPQTCCSLSSMLTPELVFDVATFTVIPMYALMVLLPKARLTRRVVGSSVFNWLSAALYATLLSLWKIIPQALSTVEQMGVSKALVLPKLAALGPFFSSPQATVLVWIHLVTLDLFQARWVYADGLREGIPTAHSIVLCFMVGPLGLLSHVLTKAVVNWWRVRNGATTDNTIVYRF